MPTKLTKRVERVTKTMSNLRRPIVVAIVPGDADEDVLEFRELGTRRRLRLTVGGGWWAANQAEVRARQREKAKDRADKKEAQKIRRLVREGARKSTRERDQAKAGAA